MRAVLDPNVLVSAVISPAGPPGSILLAWSLDQFELVISAKLLDELAEVLARPKLQRWVSQETANQYLNALAESATMIDDPPDPPKRSVDPDDDYLVALLDAADANYLVSGDPHLTGLAHHDVPVVTPNAFLAQLLTEDLPDESPSS